MNFLLSLTYSSAKSARNGCSGSGSWISDANDSTTEKTQISLRKLKSAFYLVRSSSPASNFPARLSANKPCLSRRRSDDRFWSKRKNNQSPESENKITYEKSHFRRLERVLRRKIDLNLEGTFVVRFLILKWKLSVLIRRKQLTGTNNPCHCNVFRSSTLISRNVFKLAFWMSDSS